MPNPRKKPVQRERGEQQNGVSLLRQIGAKVYVLGTTRKKTCWACGALTKDFSTRQTPGIADVYFILPRPRYPGEALPRSVWWEVKAPKGTASDDQDEFAAAVRDAGGIGYVIGTYDLLIGYLVRGGWVRQDSFPHYRVAHLG